MEKGQEPMAGVDVGVADEGPTRGFLCPPTCASPFPPHPCVSPQCRSPPVWGPSGGAASGGFPTRLRWETLLRPAAPEPATSAHLLRGEPVTLGGQQLLQAGGRQKGGGAGSDTPRGAEAPHAPPPPLHHSQRCNPCPTQKRGRASRVSGRGLWLWGHMTKGQGGARG